MKSKILVTGFEPFGGESLNPSQEIIKILQLNGDFDSPFFFALLPVHYEQAQDQLKELIHKVKPQRWLGLGQAGGREKLSLERVALNWKEVDSKNLFVSPEFLRARGIPAYFNSLDLLSLKEKLLSHHIDSEISLSAGAYICNAVYYTWFESSPSAEGLFVHLPYLPEQHTDRPHLDLKTQVQAVQIILDWLKGL
jgi:pyroglutamyl-peptidase